MKTCRLTIRIQKDLLDSVRLVAKEKNVTVTFLVEQYLRGLVRYYVEPKADEEFGVDQA